MTLFALSVFFESTLAIYRLYYVIRGNAICMSDCDIISYLLFNVSACMSTDKLITPHDGMGNKQAAYASPGHQGPHERRRMREGTRHCIRDLSLWCPLLLPCHPPEPPPLKPLMPLIIPRIICCIMAMPLLPRPPKPPPLPLPGTFLRLGMTVICLPLSTLSLSILA